MELIKNGKIFTGTQIIENGFITVDGGKFVSVGDMANCPEDSGYTVTDASGKNIYPGFIDIHTHLGMIGNGLGFESDDVNEMTNPCTPQIRGIDGLNPLDECFGEALAGGVTAVVTGPGSGNPIGGQLALIKTYGRRVEDMVVKAPVAMKMAFGENPKTVYNEKKQTPMSRMGTAFIVREALEKAKRYMAKENPEYDACLEALVPVLKREIPAHIHAHRADDILTGIRIAKEYNLDFVMVHCTEGHLITKELMDDNAHIINGPILCDRSKPEIRNLTPKAPGINSKAGIPVALCTDHPVIPIQYLPICAGLCIREGMDKEKALAAITYTAAKNINMEDRMGSIASGIDADFSIFEGDAFEMSGRCLKTYVNGECVYTY